MKIALVTGATSGIGWATAEHLAAVGYKLIICGRREERLKELSSKVEVETYPLIFDVRDKAAVDAAIASLPEEWKAIDVLINNAGNAHGLGRIQDGNVDDWEAMIDINVKGLLYMTKAVVPGMIARATGHIVNIGSVAGKEVYPNGNVYCASKHAVDALNSGMRLDLNGTGVKVSQVCPGLVETEFSLVRFKGDEDRADAVYQGFDPLTANDIADLIQFIVTRPAHVNIADTLIFPAAQAGSTVVDRKA
ncbi:SDR family NAD(P)-dependent oxidoreductase [Roseivirga pacifica]|uniref:SDR family NAD(P)-dependent oxidoreductase n=1 Tax=Roseivirga pacifica TaxID=1267423 RepID=UPI0020944B0D|nr:SDR family NAD(P)-dependent oxidoreductase [Roseivirga pacifica]MCO6357817.1 SDR family NAD(P)-dependent oxidoreductase [Roseivirga pacifica]MCO6366069.1 SDR family NAD(P)-dependent oxidoreductase [Roseivirga pacifica]MCO6371397.1 SDR family NAD(P)-dependent oxidoreductase [Roseivirga pacifica]MCO6375431.1 SDR family NAD(P)-dependent oxidoreductase [Roseivirga pacifica]MCO6378775.1 SDR family NAD(P)-dependent oxidoreductase [Roseivirga pacifica]